MNRVETVSPSAGTLSLPFGRCASCTTRARLAASSSASRTAGSRVARAWLMASSDTRVRARSTPSKRRVYSRTAAPPRTRTSSVIGLTRSTARSTSRAARGSTPSSSRRVSPAASRPRRSMRVVTGLAPLSEVTCLVYERRRRHAEPSACWTPAAGGRDWGRGAGADGAGGRDLSQGAAASGAPDALRGEPGALDERAELGPHHLRVGAPDVRRLGEAAVRAADDVLPAEDPGEALQPLGDQARVLDRGRVMGNDAGDEDLAVRQLGTLPDLPLPLVPRVRCLDGVRARVHLQDQVDDGLQRRVRDVRDVPAAEADVIADPGRGDTGERVVQRVHPQLRPAAVGALVLLDEVVVHVGEDGVVD